MDNTSIFSTKNIDIEEKRNKLVKILLEILSKIEPESIEEKAIIKTLRLSTCSPPPLIKNSRLRDDLVKRTQNFSIKELLNYIEGIRSIEIDDFNNFIAEPNFYNLRGKYKIFPYKFENLTSNYTTRTKPKILRTHNFLGNITIFIGCISFIKSGSKKKDLEYISINLSKIIDIPVQTIKTKISQLKRYLMTDSCSQVSEGLRFIVNQYENTHPKKLIKILNEYQFFIDEQLEKRFKKLLQDSSYLDDIEETIKLKIGEY